MAQALFDKTSGYYRTKNPIGKNSDFITAPEISQTFGELLAVYLLQISATKKTKFSLVEMGAGKGTLFRDVLFLIKKLAEKKVDSAVDFLERATFHIIEINEILRKIQQENLQEFSVNWYENFDEFLTKNSDEIFFISNELFDCFPIDQFVKTDIGWCERVVVSAREQILKRVQDDDVETPNLKHRHPELVSGSIFALDNFDPKIHQFVEEKIDRKNVPFNAVFEYSQSAQKFMTQLCKALKSQGGIAINFDYGYIENEFANTLQALKNHSKVDVLKNPGESDITALVDFASLIKIAKNSGLNSSLISQREFLISLGIEERRKNLIAKNPEKTAEINSAIDRLIAVDQMGDLFKCHIVWPSEFLES